MRRFLTAYDTANNIRMSRTLHSGAFLIVEGDTDMRLYEKFTDNSHCILIPASTKNNAIDALQLLEADVFEGILVIVDTDFWNLDGVDPGNPNIILTDTYDLESMLIFSDALDKVLHDFGKLDKIPKPIRDKLLESTLPIGFLRWLSYHKIFASNLNFEKLPFHKFVDRNSLIIDIDILIEEVKNNSKHSKIKEVEIKTKIEELMDEEHDPWQVCCGKDMTEILTIGLRHVFGKRNARSMTAEILDGILRVAYDDSCFCLTQLYNSVKEWERANPTFKVLK